MRAPFRVDCGEVEVTGVASWDAVGGSAGGGGSGAAEGGWMEGEPGETEGGLCSGEEGEREAPHLRRCQCVIWEKIEGVWEGSGGVVGVGWLDRVRAGDTNGTVM